MRSHELLLLEDARVALIAGETRTGFRISPEQNVEALAFFFALELKTIVPLKIQSASHAVTRQPYLYI